MLSTRYVWDPRRPHVVGVLLSCEIGFELFIGCSSHVLAQAHRVTPCCLLPAFETPPTWRQRTRRNTCSACGETQSFSAQTFTIDAEGRAPELISTIEEHLCARGACCLSASVQASAFVDGLAKDLTSLKMLTPSASPILSRLPLNVWLDRN